MYNNFIHGTYTLFYARKIISFLFLLIPTEQSTLSVRGLLNDILQLRNTK